jgi:hypothetical protein
MPPMLLLLILPAIAHIVKIMPLQKIWMAIPLVQTVSTIFYIIKHGNGKNI